MAVLMQTFEFLIRRRPLSQQAKSNRLRQWKEFVQSEARRYWTPAHVPADGPICITLVYLYDEAAPDVDNIMKPILDALIGIAYPDDAMVTDVIGRKRKRGAPFNLSRVRPCLMGGFG